MKLSALIICYVIAHVESTCNIRLSSNLAERPTISEKIGNHYADVPGDLLQISLETYEEIHAVCETQFSSPSFVTDKTSWTFKCTDRGFANPNYVPSYDYYNSRYNSRHEANNNEYENNFLLTCKTLKWNLYESSVNFSWCPHPFVSYLLARPLQNAEYQYLAELCVNINTRTIVSMFYMAATRVATKLYPTLPGKSSVSEIGNVINHFPFYNSIEYEYNNDQIKKWVDFAKYERNSLLQNTQYRKNFDFEFSRLLEVSWWQGLRLGNWILYEEAFSQHLNATHINYEVLSGVSGSVAVPIYECSSHTNRTMTEVIDKKGRTIPLYIWQYLKPKADNQNAVVIIGINTPFYNFYNVKDLIFCTNICHTIEWLQNTDYTFSYTSMGVIICCTPEEVANSKRLEGLSLAVQEEAEEIEEEQAVTVNNTTDEE
ncbi:uncharacterized protein [Musca autumnalis]|uniref:uncharacterized protein n=1 Tax=Musca autumnalis TaxID=221902 RepID=UPI003CE6A13A